jgi:ACR3 family arsenite efflux pump ArsB
MQIVFILLGAVLGLIYGANTDGFIFSSDICLFAGLTLIMPTLFNVKMQDIKLVFQYRIVILKSLIANFILLPMIALIIGLLTHNYGLAAGVFLLSVLSGGGMVMNWIKKSGADTSIGFILLFINLIFISLSLLMMHIFGIYTAEYFGESYSDERNLENVARAVITLLIIVPFLASRVVLYIEPLKNFINEKRIYISNISLFIILFYLFGLQKSQLIFELYDFEPELIPIAIIAVVVFYFSSYVLAKLIYNLESAQERAAFWYSVTRYITLALVLSTFSINTFGISIILPIMFAYIVQIPFAIMIEKKIVAAYSEK